MTVGIVDYGMGNLRSVVNAVLYLGFDVRVCSAPECLRQVDKLILPGVGAFGDCMQNLTGSGFAEGLQYEVRERAKPILGICLGMQVMARTGFEMGSYVGLGWFDAEVKKIESSDVSQRIPHIGWNDIEYRSGFFLFDGIAQSSDVFFVHSYSMQCRDESDVVARTHYGIPIVAAVAKETICATQFHPEKSQDVGLRILSNFLSWNP